MYYSCTKLFKIQDLKFKIKVRIQNRQYWMSTINIARQFPRGSGISGEINEGPRSVFWNGSTLNLTTVGTGKSRLNT